MVRYLLLLVCSIYLYPLAGQNNTITGKVTDHNNQPLPGANIYIPELGTGTIAANDGSFAMNNLPSGRFSLKVSFLSFETSITTINTSNMSEQLVVELHPTPIRGKEVVISGGSHASQHENAIKIEVISPKEITQLGTPSYMESLAQIPGVNVIGGGGGVATPVIRGLSMSNILFLNNGTRLENYQFSESHPYLSDEFGVSQVEVIKGPASLLYGSDAIGGVINSLPENPAPLNTFRGDASVRYFSNTAGINSTLGIKGTTTKLSWGVRGGQKLHKDYYGGDNRQVKNSRFSGSSLKMFTNYRIKKGIVRIFYEYQKLTPGLANKDAINLLSDNKYKNDVWYQDLNSHLLLTRNTFYLGHHKLLVNASIQENGRKLWGEHSDSGDELVDMRLRTANFDLRTLFSKSKNAEFTFAIQGMNQNNHNFNAPDRVLPDYQLNDFALFGMLQSNYFEGTHLQLGIRFDNRLISAPMQEKSQHSHEEEHHAEETTEQMPAFKKNFSNFSGSFGLTHMLGEDFLLRVNLASAHRSPNIAELTQDGEHGIRYEQGDRNLKSQRNYEMDLSLHYHKNKLLVDVSGFYNSINNYIFLSYTSDTNSEGLSIYRYTQNNAAIYGGELLIEILPISNLSARISYSYLRGQKQDGENLPFIPQNKIKSEIKWNKNRSGKLQSYYLKLGYQYAFNQKNPSEFETLTSDFNLIGAWMGINWQVGKQLIELNVSVTNLLNEKYVDHLSTLKELGYYNMGRNVSASLRLPF